MLSLHEYWELFIFPDDDHADGEVCSVGDDDHVVSKVCSGDDDVPVKYFLWYSK